MKKYLATSSLRPHHWEFGNLAYLCRDWQDGNINYFSNKEFNTNEFGELKYINSADGGFNKISSETADTLNYISKPRHEKEIPDDLFKEIMTVATKSFNTVMASIPNNIMRQTLCNNYTSVQWYFDSLSPTFFDNSAYDIVNNRIYLDITTRSLKNETPEQMKNRVMRNVKEAIAQMSFPVSIKQSETGEISLYSGLFKMTTINTNTLLFQDKNNSILHSEYFKYSGRALQTFLNHWFCKGIYGKSYVRENMDIWDKWNELFNGKLTITGFQRFGQDLFYNIMSDYGISTDNTDEIINSFKNTLARAGCATKSIRAKAHQTLDDFIVKYR